MKKILLPLIFLLTASALAISAERPSSHWKNVTVDCTVTLPDNVVAGAAIVDNSIASAKIQDNTIAVAKINYTGTANATTFFRGDGSFATPTSTSTGMASYKGLVITTPADNQTVTITADKVVVVDSLDIGVVRSSVSLTVDLDASGANGLDNGSISANTGYFVYVIDNGATTAGLVSTSATAPVMPSGYTYKALVGWCTTDNTSTPFNIEEFTQIDDMYSWETAKKVVDNGGSTTTASIDLSPTGAMGYSVVAPTITKRVFGNSLLNAAIIWCVSPFLFANSTCSGWDISGPYAVNGNSGPWRSPVVTSQTVYHQVSGTNVDVWISGFVLKR